MTDDALTQYIILLAMWIPIALPLFVIGVAFLVARRLTSPDRVKRRRGLRIIGLICVVPSSLVLVGLILYYLILSLS